jgi:hypothetical protein
MRRRAVRPATSRPASISAKLSGSGTASVVMSTPDAELSLVLPITGKQALRLFTAIEKRRGSPRWA